LRDVVRQRHVSFVIAIVRNFEIGREREREREREMAVGGNKFGLIEGMSAVRAGRRRGKCEEDIGTPEGIQKATYYHGRLPQ
jgi:hypothetical protein